MDYSIVKAIVIRSLYFPVQWPSTAVLLDNLAKGNLSGIVEAIAGSGGDAGSLGAAQAGGGANVAPVTADRSDQESQLGIKCSDVLTQAKSVRELQPVFETRRKLSRFGGDAFDQIIARCAQWQLPAKERYDGDFSKVKTKNPIMIVNNRFDPVAPLASAKNASQTFEGSVLLEQNSYGVSYQPTTQTTFPLVKFRLLTPRLIAHLVGSGLSMHSQGCSRVL